MTSHEFTLQSSNPLLLNRLCNEAEENPIFDTLEAASDQYEANRYVHIPGLLSQRSAELILADMVDFPTRRVRCGIENVNWDEQTLEPGLVAHDFFTQDSILTFMKDLLGKQHFAGLFSWTSGYSEGEFINPHTDGAGSVQLLVCLQAPPSQDHGGTLHVAQEEFFLNPGDAIAFEATSLEHYTTPLVATDTEPNPRRTVLVGRYFME
jgi:hypothetical protein